jgi:hypothetical protein
MTTTAMVSQEVMRRSVRVREHTAADVNLAIPGFPPHRGTLFVGSVGRDAPHIVNEPRVIRDEVDEWSYRTRAARRAALAQVGALRSPRSFTIL